MRLSPDVTPNFVADNFDRIVLGAVTSLGAALVDLACEGIRQVIVEATPPGTVLDVAMKPSQAASHIGWHTYADLAAGKDFDFWYLRMVISTRKEVVITESDITPPQYMRWLPIQYGDGVQKTIKFKFSSLKTKNKYVVDILHSVIPARLITDNAALDLTRCSCARLVPMPINVWHWWLEFGCRICGKTYFCDCFRSAIQRHLPLVEDALRTQPTAAMNRSFYDAVRRSEFRSGICHLCTGSSSTVTFCAPIYGSTVKVQYGHHIRKLEIAEGLTEHDAENKVRDLLGLPRIGEGWINETQLYKTLCRLLPDYEIQREASPPWLGQQRLDIYVPDLNLAVEYQGAQHYQAVGRFGGEDGLEKTKRRDAKKRSLCKANGVDLLYFKHNENIGFEGVEKKIQSYSRTHRK